MHARLYSSVNSQQDDLSTVIKHLHAFQPLINLHDGLQAQRELKAYANTCSGLSIFCLAIMGYLTGIWNRCEANMNFCRVNDDAIQSQTVYDANLNGIFDEPYETEYCNTAYDGIYQFLFVAQLTACIGLFFLYQSQKNTPNQRFNLTYRNLRARASNIIFSLEEQFHALTQEEKKELLDENLAYQVNEVISLKFVDPILKRVSRQPVTVMVKQGNSLQCRIYDEEMVHLYIKHFSVTPTDHLRIEHYGFSQALNKDHLAYLEKLEKKLNELELRKEMATRKERKR